MAVGDNWTLDYNAYTLKYTGAWTGNFPDNIERWIDIYKWIEGETDEPGSIMFYNPMEADTTKQYRMMTPWFIDDESIKATYDGALSSDGWARVEDSNIGIIQIQYGTVTTAPDDNDLGETVTLETDGDTGTLVAYDTTRKMLWIRPDTWDSSDSFDNAAGSLEMTTTEGMNVETVASEPSETGEAVWAGIYTIGNVVAETEIFIIQVNDFTEVASPALTKLTRWWNEDVDFTAADGVKTGHIDVLVKVKELGSLIDYGTLLVGAKQYCKTYAMWELTVTGGRTPVPLTTLDDGGNTSGYEQFVTSGATGTWNQNDVGTVIREDGNNRNKAIITSLSGTSPTFTIQVYYVGSQEGFAANDSLEDEGETKTLTINASAPTSVGPAAVTGVTFTLGNATGDIDEDGTNEPYAATLDCSDETLATIYEYCKYLSRRGNTGDIDNGSQTLIGEFFNALGDYYVPWDGATGSSPYLSEGENVTWTGGSGIVTAVKTETGTEGWAVIRQIRGTALADGTTITGATSGDTVDVDNLSGTYGSLTAIVPAAGGCAFGTYAGGIFTFAYGIVPTNVASADASNFLCYDVEGNKITPPQKVTVACTGLEQDWRMVLVEVTAEGGDIIKRDQHTLAAGNNQGDTDIVMSSSIPPATPGKTAGGTIICVDIDDTTNERETQYRYASWSGSTFTLVVPSESGNTCDAGGTATELNDVSADFVADNIEIGDRIYNQTLTEYCTITKVETTKLTTTPLSGANTWDSDVYVINALDRNYTGASDTAYVPLLQAVRESAGTESSTLAYSADIYCMHRVRWSSSGSSRIKAAQQLNLTVGSGGLTYAAVTQQDPVANS